MNRFVRGAIAGAAGVALLLGGARSFALWNGAASAQAGTVQSGTMTIANTPGSAAVWTVTHGGVTSAIPSISAFRIVPGDTLTLTQKVDISASGDNLSAILSLDPTSIVVGGNTASSELASALARTATMTIPGTLPAGLTAGPAPYSYKVTGALGTKTVTIVLSAPFDAAGTAAQGGTIDLTKLAFKLAQQ
ncbi:alternate-type signal peptide domain-containing protein [Leifsonia sp. LS-T14]|uniref:alternate-type signal peptide domain-containing protein n=1 Tax=unclassified Leifsonia TaxID=2663824 RepID=UPI0035A6C6F9